MQIYFREKIQLAVNPPLEVFGEQFQCTVLVDGGRYRFFYFQSEFSLLFEGFGFYSLGNQCTAVQIDTGFNVTVYGCVAPLYGVASFHHFIVVAHL